MPRRHPRGDDLPPLKPKAPHTWGAADESRFSRRLFSESCGRGVQVGREARGDADAVTRFARVCVLIQSAIARLRRLSR